MGQFEKGTTLDNEPKSNPQSVGDFIVFVNTSDRIIILFVTETV